MILVVDSSDRARLHLAKTELHRLAEHPDVLKANILVYANKQDLNGALSAGLISEALNLPGLRDRPWHIQVTTNHCA